MTREKRVIRPSSIPLLTTCAWQWYQEHIEGVEGMYNSSAAVGTSVHSVAEKYWNEAISAGEKPPTDPSRITQLIAYGIEQFDELLKAEQINWGENHSLAIAYSQIETAVRAYFNGIVPDMEIPLAVEKKFEVEIKDHPFISAVAGTIDYLYPEKIVDIKTRSGNRKKTVNTFSLQQSVYVWLAQQNGYVGVDSGYIHQIMIDKGDVHNDRVWINTKQIEYIINNILKRLKAVDEGLPVDIAFPGNSGPNNFLCSSRWCQHHPTCKFAQGA